MFNSSHNNAHNNAHKILIADDTPDIRMLVAFQLRMLGYAVVEAADGIEAVEVATKAEPDLILMDLNMPRMSGFDATRKIRATDGLNKVKIIAFSALPKHENREAALAAGCDGFSEKNLELNRLGALVQNALS